MNKYLTEDVIKEIEKVKVLGNIPNHIAMIMDGNGRWAKQRGLPRVAGHKKGVEVVREMVEICTQLGVKYLTLYTFSTENWKRPQDEVTTLMRLIVKSLHNETNSLHENNIKLTTIGEISVLPSIVQKELNDSIKKTSANTRMTLNLALSYSGRTELKQAIFDIAKKIESGEYKSEDIDEKMISNHLYTKDMPDPDLMIRSGGEMRVSNFLLWQIAYSEIYVTKTLWPDFNFACLLEAIKDYQKRERRFGLVSEQISKNSKNKNAKTNFLQTTEV
ncbi:MAG TPA: isoprenyl transferase [Melioribacteraceae bacterium]|nr:isoprenyl transferase [Melioribacteraceae bacterium]